MTDELAIARFARAGKPDKTNLSDCLEYAKQKLDEAEWDHVMVIFGRTNEESGSTTSFCQAGIYPHHGQMGLLHEGMCMIRESE